MFGGLNPNQANGYDPAGNVINDGTNQYLYDGDGRICAVAQYVPVLGTFTYTGYLYDAEGTRVAKGTITNWSAGCDTTQNGFTATTVYVLGPSGEQMTEMTNISGTWQWAHTNVMAPGLSATYDADLTSQTEGKLYFHLADWLGTRRQQTDYAGNPVLTFTGLPYGDGLSTIPVSTGDVADATEHHFTGKERDAESGNDYFGARYYASSMGRFMSPDPGWFSAADPTDPQSWNLYSYARNNPLINIDPDGYDCVYLNNAGTDVDRDANGNVTGIDRNSGGRRGEFCESHPSPEKRRRMGHPGVWGGEKDENRSARRPRAFSCPSRMEFGLAGEPRPQCLIHARLPAAARSTKSLSHIGREPD